MNEEAHAGPDYKTILIELLNGFRGADAQDEGVVARFAQAGAEALEAEASGSRWLDLEETAALLGLSPERVRGLVESGQLPAGQAGGGALRFSRLQISLYRSAAGSDTQGAIETQVSRVPSPPVGEQASENAGIDPQQEITPG